MTKAIAIRHMYSGSLYHFGEVFAANGIETEQVDSFDADLSTFDALAPDILIVMGGSMGVYEADLYPYLNHEIRILRERIEADKPTLGVCLGAQLMAASQGCRVFKGTKGRETGFLPVRVNAQGQDTPMKHFDGALTRVLHLHGDTFDVPENATLLADTELYPQAFQIGRNCFATQFHPEFHRAAFENLLVEDNGKLDVRRQREDAARYLPGMMAQTEKYLADLLRVWGIKAHA